MKFGDMKSMEYEYVDERFTEDRLYSREYLERALNESLEYRKYNEREIKKIRQQLKKLNDGTAKVFTRYQL